MPWIYESLSGDGRLLVLLPEHMWLFGFSVMGYAEDMAFIAEGI